MFTRFLHSECEPVATGRGAVRDPEPERGAPLLDPRHLPRPRQGDPRPNLLHQTGFVKDLLGLDHAILKVSEGNKNNEGRQKSEERDPFFLPL